MVHLLPVVAVGSTVAVAEEEEVLLAVTVAAEGISGCTVYTYLSPFHIFNQCNLPSELLMHRFQLMKLNDLNVFLYSIARCLNILVFKCILQR